jgi:Leucine-rich repeat (LRR) protein
VQLTSITALRSHSGVIMVWPAMISSWSAAVVAAAFLLFGGSTGVNLPDAEYSALQDLYEATNGQYWNWNNTNGTHWNFTGTHYPCAEHWAGISCSSCVTSCNVIALELSAVNLSGTLPSTIGAFAQATVLFLDYNSLFGSVPSEIEFLASLNTLRLSYNDFGETLPSSVCNLGNASILHIRQNYLTGDIPYCLGNMPALTSLFLNNNFFSGEIPGALGSCSTLEIFAANNNLLSGVLPLSLVGLVRLTSLVLSSNFINGSLGLSTSRYWENLEGLNLSYNFLSSTLPPVMEYWTKVTVFQLDSNLLTGSISSSLQYWSDLQQLTLSSNKFTHTIPAMLGCYQPLTVLALNENLLVGSVPICIWQSSYLTSLNVSSNSLTGNLSSLQATKLNTVYLSNNYFSSSLPLNIGGMTTLKYFDITNNWFSGPLNLSCVTSLLTLYVGSNMFTGALDTAINGSQASVLASIDISGNRLVGTVPEAFFSSPGLKSVSASNNCLSGSLPASICNPALLYLVLNSMSSECSSISLPRISSSYVLIKRVSLSSDALKCILELPNLQGLYFSGNEAELHFPSSVNISSKDLSTLSMSHNYISGTIPDYIFQNMWTMLDLSYNRLVGTLAPIVVSSNSESTVHLNTNRLSGGIPGSYLVLENIEVLRDNMFSCNIDRSDLPDSDPRVNKYTCGSAEFNETMLAWVLVLVFVLVLVHRRYGARLLLTAGTISLGNETITRVVSSSERLGTFEKQQQALCRNVFICNCAFVFIFLPVYCAVSSQYSSFTYKYGWYPSALFNDGIVPTAILVVLLCGYVMLVTYLFGQGIALSNQSSSKTEPTRRSAYVSIWIRFRWICEFTWKKLQSYAFRWRMLFVVLLDIVVVGGATGWYIYTTVNSSNDVSVTTSVVLALIKVLWDGPILKFLIEYVRVPNVHSKTSRMVSRPIVLDAGSCSVRSESASIIELSRVSSTVARPMEVEVEAPNSVFDGEKNDAVENVLHMDRLTLSNARQFRQMKSMLSTSSVELLDNSIKYQKELRFRLYLGFFNSICLPCLSTVLVSDSCLFPIFSPVPATTISYDLTMCSSVIADNNCIPVALNSSVAFGSVSSVNLSSTTPFVYSYQCASTVLKNFAPIFVSTAIITGFLFPVLIVGIDDFLFRLRDKPLQPRLQEMLLNLHFLLAFTQSRTRALDLVDDVKNKQSTFLGQHGSLFRKDMYSALIVNGLAVMITFGVLMPLVGVVIAVSIYTQIFVANVRVQKLLELFNANDFLFGVDLLGLECSSLPNVVSSSIFAITVLASGFWCFLMFDQVAISFTESIAGLFFLWMLFPVSWWVAMRYIRQANDEPLHRNEEKSAQPPDNSIEDGIK